MACLLDYRPFTTAGFAIRNRWITSHSFRRWIGLRPIGNCWIACYRKSSEIIDGPLVLRPALNAGSACIWLGRSRLGLPLRYVAGAAVLDMCQLVSPTGPSNTQAQIGHPK